MSARVQIIRKKVRFPFRNEKCVMHFLGIHSGLYDSSVILSNLTTAKKNFHFFFRLRNRGGPAPRALRYIMFSACIKFLQV
jgi:amino acid permease